jgi:mannose-6-phosphate isomerase
VTVLALDGVLRRYDWGSSTAIPRLLGIEPDGRPAAELWFGAHPDDPSGVPAHGRPLDALIAEDPVTMLGAPAVERFGPRLPFLLKILAADRALSIQVHPNREQAQAGFAAEDAAGVPRDAPQRNYRDPNHKPELLCALTPFDALCGFRPVPQTLALIEELDVAELAFVADRLCGPDPLRAAFTALLTHPSPDVLADALVARVSTVGRPGRFGAVQLAAQDFPADIGVVLALLLNSVHLSPGEAIYLGAGNVHCYLRGVGVEIMANSDNVLRCGLTPKHLDVDEVLKITDFSELAEPRWPLSAGAFEVPVPDFRLVPLDVDGPTALGSDGAQIVLCVGGAVTVGDVSLGDVSLGDVSLEPGHAAFVPANESAGLAGAGRAFVAGVGAV